MFFLLKFNSVLSSYKEMYLYYTNTILQMNENNKNITKDQKAYFLFCSSFLRTEEEAEGDGGTHRHAHAQARDLDLDRYI